MTGPIHLQQKTPLRVLHRRPNLTRPRTIYSVEFKVLNAHWFEMRCVAQAGAYIKEVRSSEELKTRHAGV